jgi:hypothetical protein
MLDAIHPRGYGEWKSLQMPSRETVPPSFTQIFSPVDPRMRPLRPILLSVVRLRGVFVPVRRHPIPDRAAKAPGPYYRSVSLGLTA